MTQAGILPEGGTGGEIEFFGGGKPAEAREILRGIFPAEAQGR